MQPMRLFCKEDTGLNAAVRGDKVVLIPADPSDKSQHWYQEYGNVGKLADEEGSKAFALVNRTTGQAAMWKGKDPGEGELQLALYNGDVAVEVPMLWSLGKQLDGGFRDVRALKDIRYTLNAIDGPPIKGRAVGTYPREDLAHAIWKIVPIEETVSHDLRKD